MLRYDHRKPDDGRDAIVTKSVCRSSQGSATIKVSGTEVIVNIIGPREIRVKETQTGETILRVKTFPENNTLNSQIETAIRNTFDTFAYPDSILEIAVTIIGNDGGLTATAINATILALNDAGLKFKEFAQAVTFAKRGDHIIYDPTLVEEAQGSITLLVNQQNQIICTFFQGFIEPNLMEDALKKAALLDPKSGPMSYFEE